MTQAKAVEKNLMTADTDGNSVNMFKRMGGHSWLWATKFDIKLSH